MKKIMIFAAFAALISVASCQKEAVDKSVDSPVFTATIAGDSKTTLNLSDGKIAWESNDEITVKDAASATAIYKIASIDQSTGKATFVIKESQTPLGTGPYTATYGTAPATSQTYSATNNNLYKGNLYMTAPETSTNSFTFTAACGLMKLNLTKAGESVKSVAVTGIPTGGSETTYTLNCSTAVSIATAKDFFIALPAGSYTKIVITNSSDVVCTLDANSPVVVKNNHIKPVTIVESKITFQVNIPDGALSGVFSVSPTKTVRFSKGNLWADASNGLHFENSQYGFPETINDNHKIDFFWNGSIAKATEQYQGSSYLFCDESHKVSVDNSGAIYYTLSKEEWKYLIDNHSYKWITVNNVKGYAIAPDNFNTTIADSYENDASLATDNLVFLPYTGYYCGGYREYQYDTYYGLSSAPNNDSCSVGYLWNNGSKGIMVGYISKYTRFVLRLVTDAN